ncbi:unnamed protein product [Allacma fusca]|uniref:Uncharacterized protein n=1 Tax=Allacma fusca TaxID=39272 RepID=A0A8J2L169_9HEXA|nr:unnamed protein product [Allacma fusca]
MESYNSQYDCLGGVGPAWNRPLSNNDRLHYQAPPPNIPAYPDVATSQGWSNHPHHIDSGTRQLYISQWNVFQNTRFELHLQNIPLATFPRL